MKSNSIFSFPFSIILFLSFVKCIWALMHAFTLKFRRPICCFSPVSWIYPERVLVARVHTVTQTHTHAITELNRINNWVQFRLKLKGKFTGWVCSTDSHICVGRMAYRICAVILNNSHTHDYSNAQTRRSSSFTTTEKRLRTNSKKIHA